MHLWNDYEGATLAGQWKLGQLLRTEGRSALFATTRPNGTPAVLRLTEALNDQAVLQARYRSIQAAGDKFLVKVESFGNAEFDGTPLSYAVLEPTQESLADIISGRKLGLDEMEEVATVLAGGLLALHKQGLVHGLVEPESVLAAGEAIKLRSDGARPAPPPDLDETQLEGVATSKTDAWGLAAIIYRALTQNQLHDAADALALPEPYATIVRNTARGTWGVPEIEAELARHTRRHAVPFPAAAPTKAAEPARAAVVTSTPIAVPAAGAPVTVNGAENARKAKPAAATEKAPEQPFSSRAAVAAPARDKPWKQPTPMSRARRRGVAVGIAVLVALALLVFFFERGGQGAAGSAPAQSAAVASAPVAPTALAPKPSPVAEPSPSGQAASALPDDQATGKDVWRVVAYTYNSREKAQKKADAINKKHPSFQAGVWSRAGQRPFLVTLGGPMPKEQASEMRTLARQAEVAHDVYMRNFPQ